MRITSCNEIPSALDEQNLPFILERLDDEGFSYVGCLTPFGKGNFRKILRDFFTKKIDMNFANLRCCSELNPPPAYRQSRGWQLRLLKSEIHKIYTLGYGDYLLSIGETECFVPHNNYDHSEECLRLIAGKKHLIKDIQANIYKNIGLRTPLYPTVPLHENCQHVITKIHKPK